MKRMTVLLFLTISALAHSQLHDEFNVRKVLSDQTAAWNRGNIEGFMDGYWKNDSLMFISKSGISWGWQKALENYKKKYPDTTAMGKLTFNIIVLKKISSEYWYVVGKWELTRTIGDLSGHYDLLFKKIKGRWVIIADHTS